MSVFYQPGRYRGQIVAQALGQAKTGTPQFVLRFKVLEFENGESAPAQYERTIFRSLTVNTMPYVIEDLKTLGYTRDNFNCLDPNDPNHHSFVGQDVVVFCQYEDGQDGNEREKWGIASGGGGKLEVEPLGSGKLRELNNLFGKQLRSELGHAKSQAKPTAAPNRPTPSAVASEPPPHAPVDDDDVPF
jgi:hypothetical protein